MKKNVVLWIALAACIGSTAFQSTANHSTVVVAPSRIQVPFSLSIVPTTSHEEGSSITVGDQKLDTFYVIVTNVSHQSQTLWESWNSWGYFAVSFELTTQDGRKVTVSHQAAQGAIEFFRNFPSTFVVAPGEHYVYAVQLDKSWGTQPMLQWSTEMPVKLKAVYEVFPTAESAPHKVWTGRVESNFYDLTLRHW